MKALLCYLFVIAMTVSTQAQISITQSDISTRLTNSKMNQFWMSYSTYPSLATGAQSGSSQTWNFNNVPAGYTLDSATQIFRPANLVPRYNYFPAATHGSYDSIVQGGMTVVSSQFYQVTGDGLYLLGVVQHYVQVPVLDTLVVGTIRPKRLVMPLPLTLGTVRSYKDTLDFMGKLEYRTDEFICSGYGNMTFPNGLTTAVLRVRHKLTRLTYKNGSLTAQDWGTIIDYWAKDMTNLSFDMQDSSFYSGSGAVKNIGFSTWGAISGTAPNLAGIPVSAKLEQNYPNPFNPSTSIVYSVAVRGNVLLKVYDQTGQTVATLVSGEKDAGTYQVSWSAEHIPSGVYLYELRTGVYREVKKMILIK